MNKENNQLATVLILTFCLLHLFGCATVPTKEALPVYNLNGINYFPLATLCELKGINWDYDTFSKTVDLEKGAHKINLRVGDTLVLVDGRATLLKDPIDLYQGIVVVPQKFKEQILDNLFKENYPLARPALTKIKKVIIDAGHGGNDPGAIGRSGLRESSVNLDIAKRLAKLLKDRGITVVMTRSSDTSVSLARRVDIANNSQADFFISIHSNANRVKRLNGLEIYYVSSNINDSRRALAAAQEAKPDLNNDYFAYQSLNLKAILWDMIYTYDRAESIQLARSICKTVDHSLETKVIGIKGANFYVLKFVRMPAVLIEIGFLSNLQEERLLRNSYYRQQIAEAVADGVDNYAKDLMLTEAGN